MLGAASEFDLVHLAKEVKGLLQNRFKCFINFIIIIRASHGTSGKELACQCKRPRRHGFDPWIGKISFSAVLSSLLDLSSLTRD